MANAIDAVDKLGRILDEIKKLEAKAGLLKDELKAQGDGDYTGGEYFAKIFSAERNTVDYKAMIKECNIPEEVVKQFTKTTSVTTIKVTAQGE